MLLSALLFSLQLGIVSPADSAVKVHHGLCRKHFLLKLMKSDTYFNPFLDSVKKYRIQIVYSEINRDKKNQPHLKTFSFRAGKDYIYPASMVKLPAAIMGMEKMNSPAFLQANIYDSIWVDTTSCVNLSPHYFHLDEPRPCLAQFIKEMMLVSSNTAFNPFYDFLGPDFMHERMKELGYKNFFTNVRFAPCDNNGNRILNAIKFFDPQTKALVYSTSVYESKLVYSYSKKDAVIGWGHWNNNDSLLMDPMDFRKISHFDIRDEADLLTKIIFPSLQKKGREFHLQDSDYSFLKKYMGMFPRESVRPVYDPEKYPDNFLKYFIFGDDTSGKHFPPNIRIFNKVGQSYGFITDDAYVRDTLNGVEFFLAAVIYTNRDGVLNDGKYEYKTEAIPFMAHLGRLIYNYELTRKKKFKPEFEKINFNDQLF